MQANTTKKALEARNNVYMEEVKKSRADKKAIAPRFFEAPADGADMPAGKGLRWRYKQGTYWESRSRGDWSGCRDIFGLESSAN
jgi:hypothetical protein